MQLWPRDLWALGSQTAGATECGRAWAGGARLGGRGLSMPRCTWVLTCLCARAVCLWVLSPASATVTFLPTQTPGPGARF